MMSPEEVTEPLAFGTYVEGLYLEGARWDISLGELARQNPKQLVVLMPLIQVELHRDMGIIVLWQADNPS